MFSGVSHPEFSRQAKTTAAATDYIQTSPPRVFIYYSFIPPFSFLTKHSSLLSLLPPLPNNPATLGYCPSRPPSFLLLWVALSSPSLYLIPSAVSVGFFFTCASLSQLPSQINTLDFSFLSLPLCTQVVQRSPCSLAAVWTWLRCLHLVNESCGSLGQQYYMCCSKCHCLCDSEWKTTF